MCEPFVGFAQSMHLETNYVEKLYKSPFPGCFIGSLDSNASLEVSSAVVVVHLQSRLQKYSCSSVRITVHIVVYGYGAFKN